MQKTKSDKVSNKLPKINTSITRGNSREVDAYIKSGMAANRAEFVRDALDDRADRELKKRYRLNCYKYFKRGGLADQLENFTETGDIDRVYCPYSRKCKKFSEERCYIDVSEDVTKREYTDTFGCKAADRFGGFTMEARKKRH